MMLLALYILIVTMTNVKHFLLQDCQKVLSYILGEHLN